jgi:hypothetical protein
MSTDENYRKVLILADGENAVPAQCDASGYLKVFADGAVVASPVVPTTQSDGNYVKLSKVVDENGVISDLNLTATGTLIAQEV